MCPTELLGVVVMSRYSNSNNGHKDEGSGDSHGDDLHNTDTLIEILKVEEYV